MLFLPADEPAAVPDVDDTESAELESSKGKKKGKKEKKDMSSLFAALEEDAPAGKNMFVMTTFCLILMVMLNRC